MSFALTAADDRPQTPVSAPAASTPAVSGPDEGQAGSSLPLASSNSSSDPMQALARDPEYYMEDELVVFLVERRLFKIHRYFLTRDSEFFRGLFACPPPPGESTEGRTDDQAIPLPGVTEHEFKCLLRLLYHSMYAPAIVSLDDWIALLSISTRYVFDKIRDMAIREISARSLDPIRRITLANRYAIPQWLAPAYADLCRRPEPLTDDEAETLGLKTVVRVARARESAREKGYVTSTPRSYFPHDRIFSYNERGISNVINEVWPECTSVAR